MYNPLRQSALTHLPPAPAPQGLGRAGVEHPLTAAILTVATATSDGIRKVAESIGITGGYEAVQLKVAESYIEQFGHLAKASNTMILPANVADVASMIAVAMNVAGKGGDTSAPRG